MSSSTKDDHSLFLPVRLVLVYPPVAHVGRDGNLSSLELQSLRTRWDDFHRWCRVVNFSVRYIPPQLRAAEKPSFFSALWDARIYFKSMSVGRMSIAKSSPQLRRISFIFERLRTSPTQLCSTARHPGTSGFDPIPEQAVVGWQQ